MKFLYTAVVAFSLVAVSHAQAQSFAGLNKERAGRMETTIGVNQLNAWDVSGDQGSGLDVKSDQGWNFGFGYNFDNHWNLAFAVDYNDPKFSATAVDEDGDSVNINHRMSVYSGQVNGTYHFLKGAFTPYVQAGLGWTYLDSNVSSGRPSTGCWWTWYGYVCSSYYNTFNSTEFSYSAGAGVRYEFNRNIFIRAGYTSNWIESGDASKRLDMGRLELGFLL